jgi:hypothetical protein
MSKGFDGLALMVQEKLKHDPHSGHFLFGTRNPVGGAVGYCARAASGHRRAPQPPSR